MSLFLSSASIIWGKLRLTDALFSRGRLNISSMPDTAPATAWYEFKHSSSEYGASMFAQSSAYTEPLMRRMIVPKCLIMASSNARLTEKIFDGGFFACFCKKGDSANLSGAAVCYSFAYAFAIVWLISVANV